VLMRLFQVAQKLDLAYVSTEADFLAVCNRVQKPTVVSCLAERKSCVNFLFIYSLSRFNLLYRLMILFYCGF
jgi:hypothetical protein